MRVLHISSKDIVGGGGRAAYRLHRALIAAGHDSTMVVNRKYSQDATVVEMAETIDFATYSRDFIRRYYVNLRRTVKSNTYFSCAWPGTELSGHPLVRDADIIHLHWLWDYQSVATLAKLMNLGKPVVWSFHDQRAFTGGCHFSAGCRRYEADCRDCPQLTIDPAGLTAAALADQMQFWNRDAVTVVGLSHWIAECARRSAIWRGSRIEVIPNSVETDIYRPQDKRDCRRRIGLPEDAICVLFGAEHGKEIRKGFHVLMRALALCVEDPWFADQVLMGRIRFICFGQQRMIPGKDTVPIHAVGYLNRDEDLANVYGAADFFVLPSLEDNLPNTVLESMSCGRPVLALDAGGIRDMVIEGRTGWLVSPCTPDAMAVRLLQLLRDGSIAGSLSEFCREHVIASFSQEQQARRFGELYADLLRHPSIARVKASMEDGEVPAGLECGPGLWSSMPRVFESAFEEMDAEPMNKSANKHGYYSFRRALDAGLKGALSYPEFLNVLQHAFIEGRKRLPWWEYRRLVVMDWLRGLRRKVLGRHS